MWRIARVLTIGTLRRVKKTSLYLPPELDRALAEYASSRGISKAEAVRRLIADTVAPAPRPRITAIGVIKGDKPDVSENIDRYLAESGFGED
jgi:hypothetical protein